MTAKPLAVTMGDACGIGPEIIAKAFRGGGAANAFVVGDVAVMRRAAALTGGLLPVLEIDCAADVAGCPSRAIPVLQAPGFFASGGSGPALGTAGADFGSSAGAATCVRGSGAAPDKRAMRSSR